jgi:CubicO group peptidase (beta-lactamase class C family)
MHSLVALTWTTSCFSLLLGVLHAQAGLIPHTTSSAAAPVYTHCPLPASSSNTFTEAIPEDVGMNSAIVQQALAYANSHLRISVQIFRNNCRIGAGLLDDVTDKVPFQVFSVTKSVVGMLAGIAVADGKLDINAPIGQYLTTGPGWGDAAHRAITVEDLLTETSGTRESILAEGATVGLDSSSIQEFLAQPIEHPPGSFFEYSQRNADAAAYVVQSAIGQDLQTFAQDRLFTPLGIDKSSYFWLRDRSGNTYGYAWLFIPPAQLARLGLLMQNNGNWNGNQIIQESWVKYVAKPSEHNPCYGHLFWNNAGKPCTGANIPSAQTINQSAIGSAPSDLFAMVGALQQNNFMIPSLNITVTWTGTFGDTAPDISALLSALPADLYYNFFRILMKGVQDVDVPDAGPYQAPPFDFDIDPRNYLSPEVLITDLDSSPECNVIYCNGGVPTQGLIDNVQSILGFRPDL